MVGEWQAVSGEQAGKQMTAKECEEFRIVIDERHVTYVYVGSVQSFRHAYSLDQKADPNAIDLTTKDTRRQFGSKAIYALDGDTLKIYVGQAEGKRPGEFATKADGPGFHLYVLKRR